MLKVTEWKIDNALVQELMARGFCIHARTIGPSMYPLLKTGYKLFIEPRVAAELNIGDIVFYQRGESYVVHRLIRKNGSTITTKGDNFPYYDAPVSVEQVLGRVVQIEGSGRRLKLNTAPNRILSGLITCLAHGHYPAQTRLIGNLNRLHWLIEGRRIT
jgi:signal peptidase I